MKKKKLKVQVAALAMTGAIAAAPLTVRAEEASTTAPATASTSSTEASATAAAPATSTATTPAVSGTTGGASTATASTPATGTAATAGTSTATATTEASAPAAVAAPVTVAEAPADPATTVPNNVDTVVPDDNKQGTDISLQVGSRKKEVTISAEDAKKEGTLVEKSPSLQAIPSIGKLQNKDVVLQGDLSIAKDDSTAFDSTSDAAHEVNKEDSYTLKADLDVNAVNNAINASAKFNSLMSEVDVDRMETGLRSTFMMGNDLDGSFHLPTDLEDAKKHYELSSADGSPMMYRINYGNSSFAKDKVSIAMDLDLSKYDKPKEEISTFGALNNLINKSAKKIQLIMKGIKFNATHGNVEEKETATEKSTTAEGTIRGTLVGYMKADVSFLFVKGNTSYVWGAIQNEEGRDFVAGRDRVAGNDNGNNKVDLTVKMTTTESKVKPVEPVQPEELVKPETPEVPVQPAQPVTPVAPSNGGGRTGVTPATPSRTTIPGTVLGENRPTASTPTAPVGEVLGENRVAPVAEAAEEKKGVVLGESRPSVKGVSDRASVATGDYNFTGLWASLFGISLASLAGFVVLSKKEQQ
ncbi:hypothetical protein HNQ46_000539 [Oribacterium sinus]|uniref:Uncharacterized protein n=1 Tax=Oribacterium sinus TaxID=237576 RepID=A0A7W9SFP5_9FIRM|nr:cell surface protein [Oribacterium sinus]MBB6040576.1 hypothetical protein [Oribacterium sinus]